MKYKFLVNFESGFLPPVVFDSLEDAKSSWRFSYSRLGEVKFREDNPGVFISVFHPISDTKEGTIRRIEHYGNPTHL